MQAPWNEVFKPDSGIVLEIRAYGVSPKDYDVLLPLLIQRYPAVYSEDGESGDLPDYNTITRRRNLVTTTLELNVLDVRVAKHIRKRREQQAQFIMSKVQRYKLPKFLRGFSF